MLGLLVIVIISWMLLHFFEKKNIEVLGIIPTKKRIAQFLIGLVFITLVNLLNIYLETILLNVEWKLQAEINYQHILNSFLYHLRSALTEDLIFRGAILYILIQKLGTKWGILLSAIVFGIYHVFSYGILEGSLILISYVILITGFTGYVWAYTFHKTKSIFMGLGFHLGVNFVSTLFFESQPYGELIFTEVSKIHLSEWSKLFFLLFKGLFPSILTLVFVKQWLRFYVTEPINKVV